MAVSQRLPDLEQRRAAARMPVAAVCRNRCAPMTASPARSQARATTWPMPLGDKPSHGARELRNKVRQPPFRRPSRQ
jgi:hypothetical protein